MKKLIIVTAIVLSSLAVSAADAPKAAAAAAAVTSAAAKPAVVIPPLPDTAPVVEPVKIPMPPTWLNDVMSVMLKLPLIGPLLLQVMQWLGLVASVLTILVTFLIGLLQGLSQILKFAKLADLAAKVLAFQNSPVMFWLKFFSIYNAKKTETAKV